MGLFTPQIRSLQNAYRKLSEDIAGATKDGMIPKHKAVRYCEKCGVKHTINEHRFHGFESHLRTHGIEDGSKAIPARRAPTASSVKSSKVSAKSVEASQARVSAKEAKREKELRELEEQSKELAALAAKQKKARGGKKAA